MSLKKYDLLNDIYFSKEYISLYLKQNEEIFEFKYENNGNIFYNIAIKRPIIKVGQIEINDGYFDLETAYGYGGFYTNTEDKIFLDCAFEKYEEKCYDERVIAEFIRFHPFNDFPKVNDDILDFNFYDRDIVIMKLSNNILSTYTPNVRNTVKRALEKVSIKKSNNIDKFIELYNNTMEKNSADSFYYFDKKFYKKLINIYNIELYEIISESEVIAMGFFMFGNKFGHYHLSANTAISYSLNSNYALLHNIFEIAKEFGNEYLILGGGTTSSKDDSLLKFKKKFSKETKPFYISGKIYNKDIYDRYINIWQNQTDTKIKYFLKYRLEIK